MEVTEVMEHLQQDDLAIVFISTTNCSICHADKPRAAALAEHYGIPLYTLNAQEAPEVAGRFQVLTVTSVLVYHHGKEIQRQARFIDFKKIEKILQQAS